ncbi:fimbrial protein (plasmid) [Enterobacter sp. JS8-1]|uniref:fimbrial protein n=1 Tax=Enterobacter sp. JS8-1 TaxID=3411633 RepID=UPI003BA1D34C
MTRITLPVSLSRSAMMALALLAWQTSHQVFADANINFSGTLVNAPSCTINNNNKVDVFFGDDVITRQVDGLNFKTQIVYELNCATLASNGLTVSVRGNPASFGSGLIDAGKEGLAIQLWNNTHKLANGGAIAFTWPGQQPELWATPVALDNTTLAAGPFSSTASLVLNYQ